MDNIDGKIWAQRNVSDYDIIGDLEAAGAPKSDIVLAFHIPELRRYTEYATKPHFSQFSKKRQAHPPLPAHLCQPAMSFPKYIHKIKRHENEHHLLGRKEFPSMGRKKNQTLGLNFKAYLVVCQVNNVGYLRRCKSSTYEKDLPC
jgi:hypothetical protein